MPTVREPVLNQIKIADLHPTQITVGMREVKAKRKCWREEGGKKGAEFKHMIPVVLGPKDRHYVIDHHHLARALHDELMRSKMHCSWRRARTPTTCRAGAVRRRRINRLVRVFRSSRLIGLPSISGPWR